MNILTDFYLKGLNESRSCKEAAMYLHAIATNASFTPFQDDFPTTIERIHDIAYAALNKHLATEGHTPYYIATGIEANLMYILHEIMPGYKYTPRWAMAELDYYAEQMYDADDDPSVEGLNRATEILADCFHRFPGLKKRNQVIVIVLPDIDMDGLAEHSINNDGTQTMFINTRHSIESQTEEYVYESLALLAAEDEVPTDAIMLMRQTTAPRASTKDETQFYEDYKESLKLGLAYNGPYREMANCIKSRGDHARMWNKYVTLKYGQS